MCCKGPSRAALPATEDKPSPTLLESPGGHRVPNVRSPASTAGQSRHSGVRLSRRLLATTLTLLNAMAALAIIGDSSQLVSG
ncbi:MAG: hypothetical protein GIKADHBN_03405 [Phycisphaerales bacterium]|nr:hypothetical protein [Phycisphaerales bacterium]